MFSALEPRDNTGQEAEIPTPPTDAVFAICDPGDAIGHEDGKPTLGVGISIVASPKGTIVGADWSTDDKWTRSWNIRRRVSRRHQKTYLPQVFQGMPLDKKMEN
jgi:hypothetical protein